MKNIGVKEILPLVFGFTSMAFMLAVSPNVAAKTVTLDRVSAVAGLSVESSSTGRYNAMGLVLTNTSKESHSVVIGAGMYFSATESRYQNLAAVEEKTVRLEAGAVMNVQVQTACMDPARGVAPARYARWSPRQDRGLAPLLLFLDASLAVLTPFVGVEHLSTPEKRRSFKQALNRVYYDASKDRMVSFASGHLLGGDRVAASAFIEAVHPAASMAIQIYKQSQGG